MLVAANITMQFGVKPLFENVNVKFGEGYRYGLIGANGAGKSTCSWSTSTGVLGAPTVASLFLDMGSPP